MKLLEHLLHSDPASPRLTVYNEATGARMDFSAQTLDNWASKIAAMLEEEHDLEPGSVVAIDLPVSWQAVVIALGCYTARIRPVFASGPVEEASVAFCALDNYPAWEAAGVECSLVSGDPFGRGIEESGDTLPDGAIDFGPTVRFYPDQYFGDAPDLPSVVAPAPSAERLLSLGWNNQEEFEAQVIAPLAAGGSAVVVAGPASTERLEDIAGNERVTARTF
ncbi:TIGR03089 family protein [Corynebacterium tapiri]|uniref:TIGR03089 family protein n=1 Tax=Corynebacterium tapiri TaxID=1448266 RepID=A0A5C4U655_9CORY|nr:TIGR03089 family protein [Corynebacterium tapiri]TNL98434.1 TIGR03089 family protein [Corynebacterium tapiri]